MVLMVSLRIHVLEDKTLGEPLCSQNMPDFRFENNALLIGQAHAGCGATEPRLSIPPQIPFRAFRMNHAGISTSNLHMIHTEQPFLPVKKAHL
jgi:hypothetical protein